MKLKEISVEDIKSGKCWRLLSYDNEELELTQNIMENDYIYHSAIAITKNGKVYPSIITKSYEDGGEIGDYYIYYQGRWQILSPELKELEIEKIYFSNPQDFDYHLTDEEKQENIRGFKENIKKLVEF